MTLISISANHRINVIQKQLVEAWIFNLLIKSRSHCHTLQTLRLECADSYVRPDCQYTSVSSPLLGLVDCCYTALHRQTSPDHSPRCSQSYAPSENRVSLLDNLIRCVLRTAQLNFLQNINSNSNNVNFYFMQTKTCFVLLKTFL